MHTSPISCHLKHLQLDSVFHSKSATSLIVTNAGKRLSQGAFKKEKKKTQKKTKKREATVSVAAANQISADAAVAAFL